MNRRSALKSAVSAAAGAGLFLESADPLRAAPVSAAKESEPPPPIVTADNTALFHWEWGVGKPVLFVHGWALDGNFWQYQMLRMAGQGFRCIAYDRRGHGRSADPGRGYDYDTLADDLATVLERLDLRDVTLVGHSMGTGDIVRYLSRHGATRVARVALVGATLPYLVRSERNEEGVDPQVFNVWREQLSTDFPKWLADNEAPFWVSTTSRAMKDWGRQMAWQCSLQAVVECTRALTETDFRDELRAVRLPVLIVHGSLDRSVPVHFARRTARLVPAARYIEYEGAPHGLPLTHAERFTGDLSAFVAG